MMLMLALATPFGKTTNAQDQLPEQNTAKARQFLQQVIGALGGQMYLNVRETDCQGRMAQFGPSGDSPDFTIFRDMWVLPDKNRTEYTTKNGQMILGLLLGLGGPMIPHGGGVVVSVFNGSEGWTLDKSGVSNQPEDVVKNFAEQSKLEMNNMLRSRMNEPGMEVRYAGTDLIDLKEAEWIEFNDTDHRNFRLAVDRLTHLPLRWVVTTRDPETRERTEDVTSYIQYISMDGVKTPLSIVQARNDHKLKQTFLSSCKYNSNLDAQLFTRSSLDQRSGDVSKKGYKNAKDKN